ncbi:MAG: hypothetical protein H7296_01665 [Bacteroidia bacterium]|nr:hypothetical protein [Bacteroidia bacterium]
MKSLRGTKLFVWTIITWILVLMNPVLAINFVYTPALHEAQRHLAALRLVKAQNIIEHEMIVNRDNVANDYLLEYVEFYKIMIDQDKSRSDRFDMLKNKTIERIKKLPDNDASKLYLLGSLHFQGAFVKSLFDEYLSAAFEFRTAYQFLEQNEEKFPTYLTNKKDLGALMALIGTFPESYKWIMSAVGLNGDYEKGMNMLHNYITHSAREPLIEQQQADIFYALIQLNFGSDKQVAWQFYKEHSKDYTGNLMQNYVRAYIAGKCGLNDEAITILQLKPITADYEIVPYMNFLMGGYLLNKLDQDAAIWFKKYAAFNQGGASIKEAYQRLSWCALLQKDQAKFLVYNRLMGKSGKGMGSEEKLIKEDLKNGIYPDVQLIKTRLLFDGGYFQKAESLLNTINPITLQAKYQQIEYEYRSGRVAHELKNYVKAIKHYNNTIDYSKGIETYMSPNACLQLGLLYKSLHNNAIAKEYLNKVSDYKNYDYKSSVQQKAKAAYIQME